MKTNKLHNAISSICKGILRAFGIGVKRFYNLEFACFMAYGVRCKFMQAYKDFQCTENLLNSRYSTGRL